MASASLPQKTPVHRYLDLVMAAFVTVLIVSNIASSAKFVTFGFSAFGIPIGFDGGTILFPLSYIFGDILTEVYGFRTSRRVIWTGFIALAITSGVFALLRTLPADAFWSAGNANPGDSGYRPGFGPAAYAFILGGMSSGGIVLGSLLGYWSGEFTNSAILSRMKVAMGGKMLWARTIASTLAGEFVDSIVFATVTCATRVFPWQQFPSLLITNYLFKCLVEAAMTPATYGIVKVLKKAEGVDVYDRGVKLNPFGLG